MKARLQDRGKSGIYLIRNLINGKIYIGKAQCIHNRIKQHITCLNKKMISHENQHFINAWYKYGRINFEYCVLEYLSLDENLIKQKELEYILKYNCLNSKIGYNKRLDSESGMIVSKETRKKLSDSQIKRFSDINERNKIGLKSKEFWKNNPDKLQEMATKIANINRKYKIAKCNKITQDIIEIFNTKKELLDKYPDYYYQAILGCCSGNKNSYKGFKWKYISIVTNEIINN